MTPTSFAPILAALPITPAAVLVLVVGVCLALLVLAFRLTGCKVQRKGTTSTFSFKP